MNEIMCSDALEMLRTLDALHLSESNEWYTPEVYIKAVRKVMGGIDLDPASCELANKTVRAAHFYDQSIDGLSQPWRGRVWLNPPYGYIGTTRQVGQVKLWIEKLIAEYESGNVEQAVLLVNATTEKRWFDPLWEYTICFASVRISFLSPSGSYGRPPHANAIVYFGKQEQRFTEVFDEIGPVVKRIKITKLPKPSLWDDIA